MPLTFSASPQPPSTVVPLIFFATELTASSWAARSKGRCSSVQLEVLASCHSRWLGFALLCSSVQNQVDEVIDVMQENITKVIERGERLDDLQDKSGAMLRAALLSVCPFPHISSPLLGRAPWFHLRTGCPVTDLGLYLFCLTGVFPSLGLQVCLSDCFPLPAFCCRSAQPQPTLTGVHKSPVGLSPWRGHSAAWGSNRPEELLPALSLHLPLGLLLQPAGAQLSWFLCGLSRAQHIVTAALWRQPCKRFRHGSAEALAGRHLDAVT